MKISRYIKAISVLTALCCTLTFTSCSMTKKKLKTPLWAETSVFYEIFVRSFYDSDGDGIGDFNGITQKLDYLQELGVDAIWLMPINKTESYHGYDMVDYYDIQSEYGTMADLENLINECHKRDMKIIMDLVINHTSYHHEWFLKAQENKDNEYRNRYLFTEDKTKEEYHHTAENGERFFGIFSYTMPDLNYKNETVRKEMFNVADFWLQKGMDGFRLDAAKFIDEDMAVTHEWWKEFTNFVHSKNPEAFIVGENWITKLDEVAEFYKDMSSSFNFDLCDLIGRTAQGQTVDLASRVNNMRKKYFENANAEDSVNKYPIDSTMINNHDMDRIASLLRGNTDRIKLAATMLFTLPGTPFIYYGEELGQMGEKPDPNRREPMDWYKSAKGKGMTEMNRHDFNSMKYTVADDGISYEEQKDDPNSIFNHYKKLIEIRKNNKFIFTGECETVPTDYGMYRFKTYNKDKTEFIDTVLNLSENNFSMTVDYDCTDLLTGKKYSSGEKIQMPKLTNMILTKTK